MEVLQRLGAQAPAERGHEGSRACIWRCRAFKPPHPHARLETPCLEAERDEKTGQGELFFWAVRSWLEVKPSSVANPRT